jgi:hypothetical protein
MWFILEKLTALMVRIDRLTMAVCISSTDPMFVNVEWWKSERDGMLDVVSKEAQPFRVGPRISFRIRNLLLPDC